MKVIFGAILEKAINSLAAFIIQAKMGHFSRLSKYHFCSFYLAHTHTKTVHKQKSQFFQYLNTFNPL